MHMADALLSPAVGVSMYAVSAGAIAYSAARVRRDELCEKKLPVMAVTGAFVFAAQMINFTIPATGSSGHIGGGILLAAMLGSFPALLSLASVLLIQCLIFADGGLLALGCNIFNIGIVPCFIAYNLIFKPILRKRVSRMRITAASVLSAVAGLELGSLCVVLQTMISGVTALPFGTFSALMLPIHLVIGLVEGAITAAVVCYVYTIRPEILEASLGAADEGKSINLKKPVIAFAVLALLASGALSRFASPNPDGLEWALKKTVPAGITAQGTVYDTAESLQAKSALMPDYEFPDADEDGSAASAPAAGILGSAMTFALAGAAGLIISRLKKKKTAGK
ncbi:MAG: energy-coupling factor ABC transporter permease [Oscillospiraceae bacterium]|jgi:cobalt/nickel transport system permease protein